jgi:hypothetical protein
LFIYQWSLIGVIVDVNSPFGPAINRTINLSKKTGQVISTCFGLPINDITPVFVTLIDIRLIPPTDI